MTGSRQPARSVPLLLSDILDWSARLEGHLSGVSRDRYLGDLLLQDAVARCVEVVGEASGRLLAASLPGEVAALAPVLRLADLTRNRLAHGYANIDPDILWDTATLAIPALAQAIRQARPAPPAQD